MGIENGNGMDTTMLVSPANGGFGNGFGNGFGGDWGWIILLLLCANGGWGFGGFGGMGGFAADGAMLYPWMNQAEVTTNGFQNLSTQNQITAVQSDLGDIQTQLCGGFAGVNATINSAAANAETAANARQMANMQQNFALSQQFADCCCENRLGIANLGADIAREACATRTSDVQNTQAILTAINGGIQSVKDQLCSDKIEQKNDVIAQLRSELMYARGQASQDVQTAAIQAGQRALANEVEQYVLPTPRPAYIVQNPNCCTNTCGCGAF